MMYSSDPLMRGPFPPPRRRPTTWLWLAAALALGLAAATLLLTHPTHSTLTAGAE